MRFFNVALWFRQFLNHKTGKLGMLDKTSEAYSGLFQSSPTTTVKGCNRYPLTKKYRRDLHYFINASKYFFLPSSVEQPHPSPSFPNSINNVSRRTTREIKHIVMTSANKARFDPCAAIARPVSFSAVLLSCFSFSSGMVSTEVALSSSKVGFMKDPLVDAFILNIAYLLNVFENGASLQIISAPPLLTIGYLHVYVCSLSRNYLLESRTIYCGTYPYIFYLFVWLLNDYLIAMVLILAR